MYYPTDINRILKAKKLELNIYGHEYDIVLEKNYVEKSHVLLTDYHFFSSANKKVIYENI